MEKALVWLLVLLLLLALTVPILTYLATGLTVAELAAGPPPDVKGYIGAVVFGTNDLEEYKSRVVNPPEINKVFTARYEPSTKATYVVYTIVTSEIGNPLSDWLDTLSADVIKKDRILLSETKGGHVYVYAGHYGGARDAEVGARVKVYDPVPYFDFVVPGRLIQSEGFSGSFITDNESATLAFNKKLGELKAKLLGLLSEFRQGKLTADDISLGFDIKEAPLAGFQWSVYGVLQVPVEATFWGETGVGVASCYVPHTTITLYVWVPSPFPEKYISSLNLFKGVPVEVKDVQVLGIYNGFPLSSIKLNLPGLLDFEKRLLDVPGIANKLENFLATSPAVRVSKSGKDEEWVNIPEGKIKVKFFNVDLLRGKFSFEPKIETLTPTKFFDYTIEYKGTTSWLGYTVHQFEIKILGGDVPGREPFTFDEYKFIRIKICVPVFFTATLGFKELDSKALSEKTQTWMGILKSKLGWSPEQIASWLGKSLEDVKNILARMGLLDLASRAEEQAKTVDNILNTVTTTLQKLIPDPNKAWETTGKILENVLTKLASPQPTIDTRSLLEGLKGMIDESIRTMVQEELNKRLPPQVNTVTRLLVDTGVTVRSAKMPTMGELLGPYAKQFTRIEYTPHPAEFRSPEEIARLTQLGKPICQPEPFTIELPQPIGIEAPEKVEYKVNDVPAPESKVLQPQPLPKYERPYTAEMYAKDAALMVAVVLGSVGAGLLALRLLRGRER
jgi:hypothetical protein